MPPPNDDVFNWGGHLRDVRQGRHTKLGVEAHGLVTEMERGPLGNCYRWLSAGLFEELCDADAMLQGTLLQALRKADPAERKGAIGTQLKRVFNDEYLALLTQHFTERLSYLADFFLAKAAWKKLHPKDFQEGDTAVDAPP